MVKYKLLRPGTEEYEEKKAEEREKRRPRFRGPIALYKDAVRSYQEKKDAVNGYYQNMVDEQKEYYDNDGDDWQMQEQYQRNREFTLTLLKYGAVVAVLAGLYWLFRIFF